MGRLDRFEPPRPRRWMIGLMAPVNRVAMLHGIPLLRDTPILRRIPGVEGVTNLRELDFPRADEARLAAVCGPGRATFIAPNHPEFFTDWMIDKEILARVSPMAAAWATHGVVNGMGTAMQRFWLANNLIAQIPGNTQAAREHSVTWSLTGNAVLLHPEGAVGWHGDHVAPLLPGAVDMALEALRRGRESGGVNEAYVAPVVWKLAFLGDAEPGLVRECAYVETRLGLAAPSGMALPARIARLYAEVVARMEAAHGIAPSDLPFAERHRRLSDRLGEMLARLLDLPSATPPGELQRAARKRLREHGEARKIEATLKDLQLAGRIGPFAFERPTVTQEELAEHLKRLRNDYCKGTLRDTLNRYVPRPVGPRRAIIRVPEPIALHRWTGTSAEATEELRLRLQRALDAINAELARSAPRRTYPNPFHAQAPLPVA